MLVFSIIGTITSNDSFSQWHSQPSDKLMIYLCVMIQANDLTCGIVVAQPYCLVSIPMIFVVSCLNDVVLEFCRLLCCYSNDCQNTNSGTGTVISVPVSPNCGQMLISIRYAKIEKCVCQDYSLLGCERSSKQRYHTIAR